MPAASNAAATTPVKSTFDASTAKRPKFIVDTPKVLKRDVSSWKEQCLAKKNWCRSMARISARPCSISAKFEKSGPIAALPRRLAAKRVRKPALQGNQKQIVDQTNAGNIHGKRTVTAAANMSNIRTIWTADSRKTDTCVSNWLRSVPNRDINLPIGVSSKKLTGALSNRLRDSECNVREALMQPFMVKIAPNTCKNIWLPHKAA
mmetsp:Transcript_36177/g.103905  ORF Transcript_36177/g.103905 Transcript_36177/m.103905 type:complete len:205 (+) Transcript_36177:1553-2167(+)